jgi:hypothetical protein
MVTRPDLGGAGLVIEDGLSLHNPIVAALIAQFPMFSRKQECCIA